MATKIERFHDEASFREALCADVWDCEENIPIMFGEMIRKRGAEGAQEAAQFVIGCALMGEHRTPRGDADLWLQWFNAIGQWKAADPRELYKLTDACAKKSWKMSADIQLVMRAIDHAVDVMLMETHPDVHDELSAESIEETNAMIAEWEAGR